MLKVDYTLNPGRQLNMLDFELDDTQQPIISIITPYYNGYKYGRR